jgi:hypothetical protein
MPEILKPWSCQVCGATNKADLTVCSECTAPQGTLHALSRERLLGNSSKIDELSIAACTVTLADGTHTSPLVVDSYSTRDPIIPKPKAKAIPLYAIKTPERVEVFLDLNHVVFKSFRVKAEQMIASEVSLVIYDANRRMSGQQYEGLHTLSSLAWQILQTRWRVALEDSADRLRSDVITLFTALRERLPIILKDRVEVIYDDLDEQQQRLMVENMLSRGTDLMKLQEIRKTGQYLHFIDEGAIVMLFKENTAEFFDGRFWNEGWSNIGDLPGVIVGDVQNRTKSLYLNCLEDLVGFLRYRQPDMIIMQRARASLMLLQQKLA